MRFWGKECTVCLAWLIDGKQILSGELNGPLSRVGLQGGPEPLKAMPASLWRVQHQHLHKCPSRWEGLGRWRQWKTTPRPAKSYKSSDCNSGVYWNRTAINNHSVIFIIAFSETNQFSVSQFAEAETISLEVLGPWLIVSMSTSQSWLPSSWRVQGNSHCSNSLEFPGLQIWWLWLCCWVKYNTYNGTFYPTKVYVVYLKFRFNKVSCPVIYLQTYLLIILVVWAKVTDTQQN